MTKNLVRNLGSNIEKRHVRIETTSALLALITWSCQLLLNTQPV